MNVDDVTLLTAYLDDELDEPDRSRIEAAVRANPHLADQLRELAQVRDLVSGMSRPVIPCDLGLRVTAEIERRRHRLGPAVWWQFVRTAALVAAAILVAVSLWQSPRVPVQRRLGGPAVVRKTPPRATPAPVVAATRPSRERTEASTAPRTDLPLVAKHQVAGPDEDELQSERDRQRLLRLLDEPSVQRVFIVGDQIDTAADQVDDLLRNTARRSPRFGRISVNQGIVVDPKHPDEARVFIAVMDEKELSYFRSQVEKKTQLGVQADGPAPAGVVTLLADFSQVSIVEGSPAATVLRSPPPEFERRMATQVGSQSRSVEQETVRLTTPDGLPPPDDMADPSALPPGAAGVGTDRHAAGHPAPPRPPTVARGELDAGHGARGSAPNRVSGGPGVSGPTESEPLLTVLVWVTPREAAPGSMP